MHYCPCPPASDYLLAVYPTFFFNQNFDRPYFRVTLITKRKKSRKVIKTMPAEAKKYEGGEIDKRLKGIVFYGWRKRKSFLKREKDPQ